MPTRTSTARSLAAVAGSFPVRLNLWLFNGAAPTSGLPTEVVVESFAFAP
jgi:hypothetical protein